MPEQLAGAEGFERHYRQLYGARWTPLREALLERPEKISIPGLGGEYAVDPASWEATQLLRLRGNERVVDLCAAPGGKSLALALRLPVGELHANDSSRQRYYRLQKNLALIPPGGVRVSTSCADATRWGLRYPRSADCLLLDAPCSSERHLLRSPAHLRRWTPARSRMLAQRQLTLACAACDTLRPGGELLYLTCALSPLENELLVAKLLRKRPCLREVVAVPSGALPCNHGGLLLPDQGLGGPLYFCLLSKSVD